MGEVLETVAIAIEQKKNDITEHTLFHNNITIIVCILVQHFTLCSMGNRMVLGMALFFLLFLL